MHHHFFFFFESFFAVVFFFDFFFFFSFLTALSPKIWSHPFEKSSVEPVWDRISRHLSFLPYEKYNRNRVCALGKLFMKADFVASLKISKLIFQKRASINH